MSWSTCVHMDEIDQRTWPSVRLSLPQVQLSILDQRPLHSGLAQLCQERNVTLLCYGTLLGGFLTDQWLDAKEPDPKAFDNVSEEKVRLLDTSE